MIFEHSDSFENDVEAGTDNTTECDDNGSVVSGSVSTEAMSDVIDIHGNLTRYEVENES